MKIVATVTNVASVVHCGGHAESRSAIIDIPDSALPSLVLQYLTDKKRAHETKNWTYENLSFSILQEDAPQKKVEAGEQTGNSESNPLPDPPSMKIMEDAHKLQFGG